MQLPIQAVLFDFDGVLVQSPLDLGAIKRELFGDEGVFIIEGLANLPEHERSAKNVILLERELKAAEKAILDPAVPSLFEWLESRGMKRGIVTRNHRDVVDLIIKEHNLEFDVIIGRDDAPPKPDPASVMAACEILEIEPSRAVMVGDFMFDIEAGKSAGCRTVFIETEQFGHFEPNADVRISSLAKLSGILEIWLSET